MGEIVGKGEVGDDDTIYSYFAAHSEKGFVAIVVNGVEVAHQNEGDGY